MKRVWDIRTLKLNNKEWAKYTSKNAIEEDINKLYATSKQEKVLMNC